MENKNVFHERLTELMIEKGVNTVSLALALGVSDETVRRWKNGQRYILLSQLVKLADYFQCSLDFLAGRSDEIFVSAKIRMYKSANVECTFFFHYNST